MEKKTTLLQHTLTYGAILGIVSIIISLVLYIAGYMPVSIKSTILTALLSIAVTIIFVSYGMKMYRDKILNGSISYGQAFVVGLLIIIFSSLLVSIYNLIFTNIIDPEYMSRVLEASRNSTFDMMSNMGATDAQIEESMDRFDDRIAKMTPMRTFIQGLVWSVIFGAIISLIVAAFTRKSKNPVA